LEKRSPVKSIDRKEFYSLINLPEPLIPLLGGPLARLLALDEIDSVYQDILDSPDGNILDNILSGLNISIQVPQRDMERVPSEGPVIVVANHPYGGIEGILLSALLRKVRPDFKILVNRFLQIIPELRPYFIFVDVFGGKNSAEINRNALREALDWVASGALLAVFPAGAVSHFQPEYGGVSDPAWKTNITRLIHKTKAPVVPVYFSGHNKLGFQMAGMMHPILRTIRLPRELLNKRNQSFDIAIGNPIPFQYLNQFNSIQERTDYLRLKTYNLASRYLYKQRCFDDTSTEAEVITPAFSRDKLIAEIDHLPERQILFRQKGNTVIYAGAEQIPGLGARKTPQAPVLVRKPSV